jgi:hypothetical protein
VPYVVFLLLPMVKWENKIQLLLLSLENLLKRYYVCIHRQDVVGNFHAIVIVEMEKNRKCFEKEIFLKEN